jgi:Domain of unknown function (DUF4253)
VSKSWGLLPYLTNHRLTRKDALDLAREQYIYCSDIVSQGTGTLEALAAGLLGGTAWFFWWD